MAARKENKKTFLSSDRQSPLSYDYIDKFNVLYLVYDYNYAHILLLLSFMLEENVIKENSSIVKFDVVENTKCFRTQII